ncbi:hypothetical protein BGC_46180 [Burkholderia sp. 3C]
MPIVPPGRIPLTGFAAPATARRSATAATGAAGPDSRHGPIQSVSPREFAGGTQFSHRAGPATCRFRADRFASMAPIVPIVARRLPFGQIVRAWFRCRARAYARRKYSLGATPNTFLNIAANALGLS